MSDLASALILTVLVNLIRLGYEAAADRWFPLPRGSWVPRGWKRWVLWLAMGALWYPYIAGTIDFWVFMIALVIYTIVDSILQNQPPDDRWKKRRRALKAKLTSSTEALRDRIRVPVPEPVGGSV